MEDITLYGNEVLPEVREYMYAEAEMAVSYNLIQDYFFNLMDSFRDETVYYAESDDEGDSEVKVGFFRKIGQMFKKMWRAIIDFIKTVFRKTWEILSKPFSFKMNKANNDASGGGSSSSTTERTKTANVIEKATSEGGAWSSIAELVQLRKTTVAYIKTVRKLSQADVSVQGASPDWLGTKKLDSLADLNTYKKSNYTDKITFLKSLLTYLNQTDEKSEVNKFKKINETINFAKTHNVYGDDVRIHKSIAFKYERIKDNDSIKGAMALVVAGMEAIADVGALGAMVVDTNDECSKPGKDQAALFTECKDLVADFLDMAKKQDCWVTLDNNFKTVLESDIDKYKLYGIPSKYLLSLLPLFMIYSFDKKNIVGEGCLFSDEDFKNTVESISDTSSLQGFNALNFEKYKNLLKGDKMFDTKIFDSAFETVNVKGESSLSSIVNASSESEWDKNTNYEAQIRILRQAYKDVQDLDKDYKAKENNKYQILKEDNPKTSSEALKAIITGASACLKAVTRNALTSVNIGVRLDNACTAQPHIWFSLIACNTIRIVWDQVCYAKGIMEENLANNNDLIEDMKNNKVKVEDFKDELNVAIKEFDVQMNKDLKGKYKN